MQKIGKNTYVVIPGYNESKHIRAVLKKTKTLVSKDQIIVVDDGSKDTMQDEAFKEGVYVLRNIVNMGKGAALRTGCDFAIKKGAKKIIVMDSDGQHDPSDIPLLEKELNAHNIVFTYRKFSKHMPPLLRFGNQSINKIIKFLYGISLFDTQCGFRGFSAKAYKKIRWKANDYTIESEMIARAGRHKLTYNQIPIATIYHDRYKGTTVFDGIKIVTNMITWKIMRLK